MTRLKYRSNVIFILVTWLLCLVALPGHAAAKKGSSNKASPPSKTLIRHYKLLKQSLKKLPWHFSGTMAFQSFRDHIPEGDKVPKPYKNPEHLVMKLTGSGTYKGFPFIKLHIGWAKTSAISEFQRSSNWNQFIQPLWRRGWLLVFGQKWGHDAIWVAWSHKLNQKRFSALLKQPPMFSWSPAKRKPNTHYVLRRVQKNTTMSCSLTSDLRWLKTSGLRSLCHKFDAPCNMEPAGYRFCWHHSLGLTRIRITKEQANSGGTMYKWQLDVARLTPSQVHARRWLRTNRRQRSLFQLEAKASSQLRGNKRYRYHAAQLVDGNGQTAWCEGKPGNGLGQSIILKLNAFKPKAKCQLKGLVLVPGYVKSDRIYRANNRVTALDVATCHGPRQSVRLSLPLAKKALNAPLLLTPAMTHFKSSKTKHSPQQTAALQSMLQKEFQRFQREWQSYIKQGKRTKRPRPFCLRLTVRGVKRGRYRDTCMSEVALLCR